MKGDFSKKWAPRFMGAAAGFAIVMIFLAYLLKQMG